MDKVDRKALAGLQAQLRERWARMHQHSSEPLDVVVVPSLSLEGVEHTNILGVLHYEERMLFTLNLLRDPNTRVVYLSSEPIEPAFVDYILSFIRDVPLADMRRRLTMLSAADSTKRPLTEKILARPELVARIAAAIEPSRAYLTTFAVSEPEEALAVQLGIPLYGCDTSLLWLGTKSGSRWAFKEAGVPVPPGVENLESIDDVVSAIAHLNEADPDLKSVVVKHNSGFSGMGNAVLDLSSIEGLHKPGLCRRDREQCIAEALVGIRLADPEASWESYQAGFEYEGGIVEAFVRADCIQTPSTQLRVSPEGDLRVVSTHDQIMSGPEGQVYAGCLFPASPEYRQAMQQDAVRVGEVLKNKGVVGRFAIDFMALKTSSEQWEHVAIEINLRLGGTTHPLMFMKLVNGGNYDHTRGIYTTAKGEQRCYMATDALEEAHFKGLELQDLLDIADTHGLSYQSDTDTGVVFHLTGAMQEFGKLGMTVVERDRDKARVAFERARSEIDSAAKQRSR